MKAFLIFFQTRWQRCTIVFSIESYATIPGMFRIFEFRHESWWIRFVVRVNDGAPKRIRSRLKYSSFHRENRKRAQTHQDIKDFLRSMPKDTPGWEHFSDFHLLIYIAKLFDVGTACTIAEAVANQQDIPDGVRILINGEWV